ncbi:NAD-independent L-lactate dehydrogenase LldEFG, oxidoreductase subunit [Campylobacter blaseri]|uniref:Oxidoreductase n=1 Tax=Campylobacter blaseri TaxID=2042961 RepID=A0A2P8R117_9BACT|nr:(Fe-S)-binding protein [Campylobacter blaseri]PSM52194.1 oxidoreductase [Campylobacter blaseri]PSM53960.1 oxidoreductase [Campylobacter blaseri]QKF85397.1 NAD-independent L-lactate dehydrogenase LldEFG, oxidoreductase subunit [Campylobacter blaseri]
MKKVYLFSTCLGTALMGKMVKNTILLLQKEGIEVIFKKDQTCCGQPGFNTGYFKDTKKIALYNAKLFNEDYPVLVPSGSCSGMMMHDYLELFKDDKDYEAIKNFSSRVYDLSVYLDKVLDIKLEDKGEPIKVTWHSNCHALRIAKSIESSKALIKKLKNVELIELEHEEECCGFGGTFAVKEPEISNAMAMEKIKDIKNTGCKYLISSDGGCLMNIAGTISRNKEDIKTIHLYDFLLKRINGEVL